MHTLLLTREMASQGYRTLLVAGACESEQGDLALPLDDGEPVCWIPELSRSVRPLANLKALWNLWRLMRLERPAIVHTHTAMAGCLGRLAAILNGVPVIVHTFHGNSLSRYFSPHSTALFQAIEKLLARFTDVLCVVAPQQVAELSGKLRVAPLAKFRIVPLGLDLDACFDLPGPPQQGPFTVGWFGRMVPVKDVPLLVRVIEATLRRDNNIRFVVAGDGPDRAALANILDFYGERVTWLGWQSDILPALSRCHAVVQTSRNEGTPVALIQAMAAARPFVSTAVGGVPDMVVSGLRWHGEGSRWYANGVLAGADPESISRALETMAYDRALVTRMGCEARAFAFREYRAEVLVRNLDALYRELLQKKNYSQESL